MKTPSAAQEVADWLQHQAAYTEFTISQYWPTQLLREDRQRRQMERFVLKLANENNDINIIAATMEAKLIARRLRKERP